MLEDKSFHPEGYKPAELTGTARVFTEFLRDHQLSRQLDRRLGTEVIASGPLFNHDLTRQDPIARIKANLMEKIKITPQDPA